MEGRMSYNYILNKEEKTIVNGIRIVTNNQMHEAVQIFNKSIDELDRLSQELAINIFETLGMRNLSGFIGEVFASSLAKVMNGNLVKNLHQDGYPDLLFNYTDEMKSYYKTTFTTKLGRLYPVSKEIFSPYKYGGLEVKSTCGSTPSATSKVPKPLIGEQRIDLVNQFDWKAHHRETNNLIGLLWDFIEGKPMICAVFFRNDLTESDWGNIVQPREGGGRTTSVSIMNSSGILKMCQSWVMVIDDQKYINKLAQRKWIGHKVK